MDPSLRVHDSDGRINLSGPLLRWWNQSLGSSTREPHTSTTVGARGVVHRLAARSARSSSGVRTNDERILCHGLAVWKISFAARSDSYLNVTKVLSLLSVADHRTRKVDLSDSRFHSWNNRPVMANNGLMGQGCWGHEDQAVPISLDFY